MPDNFFPAFRHLHMIFQHPLARIRPSAAVYGRAGCIFFYYLQFGLAWGVRFTSTSSMDVQGVSSSTASSMDVQGVSFQNPAAWMCRVYPFQLPVVRMCRVSPSKIQQHGCAGCIPFNCQ
jgi:hypothetical protein